LSKTVCCGKPVADGDADCVDVGGRPGESDCDADVLGVPELDVVSDGVWDSVPEVVGVWDSVAVCVAIWLSVIERDRPSEMVCDGLIVPLRVLVAVSEGVCDRVRVADAVIDIVWLRVGEHSVLMALRRAPRKSGGAAAFQRPPFRLTNGVP
jgi:hypothetical protein